MSRGFKLSAGALLTMYTEQSLTRWCCVCDGMCVCTCVKLSGYWWGNYLSRSRAYTVLHNTCYLYTTRVICTLHVLSVHRTVYIP